MTMRVAVLGGGVMGETLASGLLRYVVPRPEVVIVERRPERAEELRERHGVAIASAVEAVRGADVVILVVKPQDVTVMLDEVGAEIEPGSLLISIAAGIRTDSIEARVRAGVNVVRAMPNTPAKVDRAVTGVSGGSRCDAAAVARAVSLLESVGAVVEVPESLQDAVTAVSGSGPAYVFFLAEAMIAAAVELGLEAETAQHMVHHTILGSAMLLDSSGDSAAALRRNVTSPNGTTAAAVASLEEQGVHQAIVTAITAARDRSRALSGG